MFSHSFISRSIFLARSLCFDSPASLKNRFHGELIEKKKLAIFWAEVEQEEKEEEAAEKRRNTKRARRDKKQHVTEGSGGSI